MNVSRGPSWFHPEDRRLLAGVAVLQVLLIGLPALWSPWLIGLIGLSLLTVGCTLFSVRRTLLALLLLDVAVPGKLLLSLVLPGGIRLQEAIFLAALCFALIDLVFQRHLAVRSTRADLPVLLFLGAVLLSWLVGLLHHNLNTVILRDVRFPLYYGVFFLVTHFFDRDAVLRRFLPLLILAALIVGAEYVLEFLGAIDLSTGSRFVRVARLQGLVLPVAMLFLVNQFLYAPLRYGRWLLAGLFLPISLAFVLTVGRGMWVSFGIGLVATVLLWHRSRPAERRKAWQAALMILVLVMAIGATAFLFQRITGASVGAHALARSRSFVDFTRDVHVLGRLSSYLITLEAIVRHPLLGNGQGATLAFFTFSEELDRFVLNPQAWTVDSLYLALLWKMGLIGLGAFGWMGIRLFRLAHRLFTQTRDSQVRAFAGGAVAVLAGTAVLGISDASMVWSRLSLVFGMLFGSIAVLTGEAEEE